MSQRTRIERDGADTFVHTPDSFAFIMLTNDNTVVLDGPAAPYLTAYQHEGTIRVYSGAEREQVKAEYITLSSDEAMRLSLQLDVYDFLAYADEVTKAAGAVRTALRKRDKDTLDEAARQLGLS